MFGNALMEVSGRITDIMCIAQITCKFINNALPIYNTRLYFFRLKILFAEKVQSASTALGKRKFEVVRGLLTWKN